MQKIIGKKIGLNGARELIGAAFLMATSAIGPGFLTQTALFTQKLGADFIVVIVFSTLLDIAAQLTIWRVIVASKLRAQELVSGVLRGSGNVLAIVVALGGFVFNIGNVAGAGLGLISLTGLPVEFGAVLSAVLAILLFLAPEAGKVMDRFATAMGAVMLILMLSVAVIAKPSLLNIVNGVIAPTRIDVAATLTLVGGTVGGYITFAGAHRLLDAGVMGLEAMPKVNLSAGLGIIVAAAMRVLLFVAAFGVISTGGILSRENPAASVFTVPLGQVGMRLFGLVMWAAAMTSIVGSAYTSVSFLRSLSPRIEQHQKRVVVGFTGLSALIFILIGKPVQILVFAGLVNSFVIPFALALILFAAYKPRLVGDYRQPLWLTIAGAFVTVLLLGMSLYAVFG